MHQKTLLFATNTRQYAMKIKMALDLNMNVRAEKAGDKAVMITVDAPMLGRRLNEYRNSFGIPEGMGYPNIVPGTDMANLVYPGKAWNEERLRFRGFEVSRSLYTAEDVSGAIQHGVDGGIRRGTDIKALSLGADYCFAARNPIWGLAYDGQKGVELPIRLLEEDFKSWLCLYQDAKP
ncbi:FMN-dependent dehydrogenase family protein [Penicillium argentinense]|uniref:FMN-dependent dehydrogenase family protein n=1 Tax=Penicillium argentinense TaxID=1131581 RepID=A0A9W9KEK3_9EURO|nr:FMN-dependent dehydrogenase family protein [Penicillium argentinense]KAJ5102823.1 FMN-dependent dehydrogenase family protein [Penicillium argentinense]